MVNNCASATSEWNIPFIKLGIFDSLIFQGQLQHINGSGSIIGYQFYVSFLFRLIWIANNLMKANLVKNEVNACKSIK
jgi:hypothetical protein